MNNKFALSFGISLVIVGLLNIILRTSNIIIFGLSASTIMFSLINLVAPKLKSKKAEFLYIIPFVILVSIFCYSDSLMEIKVFADAINGRITNILTFISFGLLFVSEYYNHTLVEKKNIEFQDELVVKSLEYSALILNLEKDYALAIKNNPSSLEKESKKLFDGIRELCDEQIALSKINMDLLKKKSTTFTIKELNDIYKKHHKPLDVYGKMEQYYKEEEKNKKSKSIKNKAH